VVISPNWRRISDAMKTYAQYQNQAIFMETENNNVSQREEWTDRDLNPRPPDCKSGDLPV
jgi:hypothetical protein